MGKVLRVLIPTITESRCVESSGTTAASNFHGSQVGRKAALGTGSTTGIGVCNCRSIGKGRASVVVNGRTEQRVKAALKQLQHSGTRGKVEGLAANLGTADGVQQAIARFPVLDILVNNLGVLRSNPSSKSAMTIGFTF